MVQAMPVIECCPVLRRRKCKKSRISGRGNALKPSHSNVIHLTEGGHSGRGDKNWVSAVIYAEAQSHDYHKAKPTVRTDRDRGSARELLHGGICPRRSIAEGLDVCLAVG